MFNRKRFRIWTAPALVALGIALCAALAQAQTTSPPYDLRHLGKATAWAGCFEAHEVEAANPANLEFNTLGFIGTPTNRRVEVDYEITMPDDLEVGVKLTASMQLRCVRHEGWEPASIHATVKHESGRRPVAQLEHQPNGSLETWSFSFDSLGPGAYQVSLRIGGVEHFAGRVGRTFTLIPEDPAPLTRERWFAAHLIDETVERAFPVVQTRGEAVQPAVGRDFPATAEGGANTYHWEARGVEPRDYGVGYTLQLEPEDVGRDLSVGIVLQYPLGEGTLRVLDPTDATVLETRVYPSPEVRTIWIPFRPEQFGAYDVQFEDRGSGRANASVYALCYLKTLETQAPSAPAE